MGRKASREEAMKLIYQLEIQKEDRDEQISSVLQNNDFNSKDKVFILDVVNGVFNNQSLIDNKIAGCSKGWKIGRISRVDLAILRLSIYEMLFREDIPMNVSINEAIELAKKFSGQDAGAFINGVLGKIAQLVDLPQKDHKL